MTPAEIHERIADIRLCAGDDEGAHSMEDKLWSDVLAAIARGDVDGVTAMQCAAIALTSKEIGFSRWCA